MTDWQNDPVVKSDEKPAWRADPVVASPDEAKPDDVTDRATFLPIGKTREGKIELAFPGILADLLGIAKAPREVMEGRRAPEEAAREVALGIAGGGVAGRVISPKRALKAVEKPKPVEAAPAAAEAPPVAEAVTPGPEAAVAREAAPAPPEAGAQAVPEDIKPSIGEPPIELLPKLAGNINLERISAPDDVKAVINDTAEALAPQMDQARRGTISLEETSRLADALGTTPEQLAKRRKGQAFNAEQAVAARNLLADSATNVTELAKAATGGSDEALAAFMASMDRHAMIQQQVAGLTAEAGRTLSSFRIASKADKTRLEQLKGVLDASGGRAKAEDLAAMVNSLAPDQVGAFITKAGKATTSDMLLEAWINALLSGPRTHVVNTMSNTLTALWDIPETAVASAIGVVRGKAERVPMSEPVARLWGMIEGVKDGARMAAKTFITEEPSSALGKIEARRQKAIPGPFGKLVRLPGRMLLTEDEFFKAIGYRQTLRGLAARDASRLELKGREAAEHIATILTEPPEEIALAARKEANTRTFTSALGDTGQAVQRFANAHPAAKVILPFIRTPVNLVKYAVVRSPFGLLSKRIRNEIMKGGPEGDLAAARIALGSGLAATIASYAAEGKITGSGPVDPQERALWLANNQPYSIRVGDKWVSYARLDPFATIMGSAADLAALADRILEADVDEIAARIAMAISQNLVNKTWLSGISQVVEAVGDPARYGESWVQNLAGTLVPTVVAHITQTMDPALRDTQSILDKWKSRLLPTLSTGLPVVRDLFGQPILREGAVGPDILSPFFQKDADRDPVARELLDLGFTPSKPERQVGGVELDTRQYDALQILSGKTFRFALEKLMGDPTWTRLPKGAKDALVRGVFRESRDIGRQALLRFYPELLAAQAKQRIEELTAR